MLQQYNKKALQMIYNELVGQKTLGFFAVVINMCVIRTQNHRW